VLSPRAAVHRLRAGDIAFGRIDVLPTLDPEPSLGALRALEERRVVAINRPGALLGVHDKLATALRLAAASSLIRARRHGLAYRHHLPVAVKPRFGSWGRDVTLCRTPDALSAHGQGVNG
jgi:glutathione synthase/RimK-type ligase-like ATP-grasp enzyme